MPAGLLALDVGRRGEGVTAAPEHVEVGPVRTVRTTLRQQVLRPVALLLAGEMVGKAGVTRT
jgi:hypothetical protein